MSQTSGNLRYPVSTDPVNVPGDIRNLAEDVDSRKAPLVSPSLSGIPTAPTAEKDTSTTQIATTSFVIGQAATVTPAAVGTPTAGTSNRYARADHSHALPTGTYLLASSLSNDAATSTGITSSSGTSALVSRADHVHALGVATVDILPKAGSHTLVLTDSGGLIEMGSASAQTLTIPTDATVAFPIGTKIDVIQTGAGQVTVAGAVGVTVNSTPGLKISAQWGAASLVKRGPDTWVVVGGLSA